MGISIWQLVIVLVIVLLLFGTKRLKNIGSDLGGAIKGFKKAVTEGEKEGSEKDEEHAKIEEKDEGGVIEGEATEVKEKEGDKG